MSEKISRRTVLSGIGATVAGTSIAYISTRPTEAQATVEFGNLQIPDSEYIGQDIQEVNLSVDATYSYEASHSPDEYSLTLLVGDADTTIQPIDSVTRSSDLTKTETGEHTLSGLVTSTYHFDVADFEPATDTTKQSVVYVALRFKLKRNSEVIAESELIEPVNLIVDGTTLEATAKLNGTGAITIK